MVTYGNGIETLYVNGEEHQITVLDRPISLYDELDRLFSAEYGRTYWLFMLCPLGFLSYVVFSRNAKDVWKVASLSVLLGAGILAGMEGLRLVLLSSEVELSLITVGTYVVILSVLTGAILHKAVQAR